MFLVSTPQMVIESGRAGVIGSFPLLNARPAEECAKWLVEVKEALGDIPWAVNFISHRGSNKRYDEDVELIREHQPPIVITSLGSPAEVLEIVHAYGGLVYSDVANAKHAKKAAQSGVDGLILVCAGAGGHGAHSIRSLSLRRSRSSLMARLSCRVLCRPGKMWQLLY